MRRFFSLVIGNRFVREGCFVTLFLMLLISLQSLVCPKIYDIHYMYAGEMTDITYFPVAIPVIPEQKEIEGWTSVNIHPWQTKVFHVSGDDCLTELEVNKKKVKEIPNCRIGLRGKDIDLSNYVHIGRNEFHVKAADSHGARIGFSIESSQKSLLFIITNIFALFVLIGWIFSLFSRTLLKNQPEMSMLLGAGFLIRALYVSGPSSMARTYDTDGHIEYIQYMMQNWHVPPAAIGWEFHQGPLYYFLMAIVMKIVQILGFGGSSTTGWILSTSLLASCLTLGAAAWCALVLFPEISRRKTLIVFFAIIAFFPGLLFFCSRINNDVLLQLLGFLFLGCLLTWWKNGKTSWLLMSSIVIGLGFLTKANSFLFAPILLICILFRPSTSLSVRLRWVFQLFGVITLMAGWLLVIRYLEDDFIRLFAPGNGMNEGLSVPNTVSTYLVFNPMEIVAQPYASAWDDSTGRQYFWMFLFKTSLFGEFSYPKNLFLVSRILVVLLMGGLAMSIAGIMKAVRNNDRYLIPLLVSTIIITEGAFGYRWLHPAASNQDFRYSFLLLPLLTYFAVRSMEGKETWRIVLRTWLLAFVCCCLWFLFLLSIQA